MAEVLVLVELNPDSGAWPTVPQDGPALFDEARVPIEAYYHRFLERYPASSRAAEVRAALAR